jgi:hypothetical protein
MIVYLAAELICSLAMRQCLPLQASVGEGTSRESLLFVVLAGRPSHMGLRAYSLLVLPALAVVSFRLCLFDRHRTIFGRP